MRLIDADSLKERIKSPDTWETAGTKRNICKMIDSEPTAGPKAGAWIAHEDGYNICPFCKTRTAFSYPFCPYCGSIMKEVKHGGIQ